MVTHWKKKIQTFEKRIFIINFNFSEICVMYILHTLEHPRFKIHSSDSFGRFFHQIIQGIVTELVNDDMSNFGGARGRWNALSTEDTYGAAWKILFNVMIFSYTLNQGEGQKLAFTFRLVYSDQQFLKSAK